MPANTEKAVRINRLRRLTIRRPDLSHRHFRCRVCDVKWFAKRKANDEVIEMHQIDCEVYKLTCEVITSGEMTGLKLPIPVP